MFHTDDEMYASKSVARLPDEYQLEALGLWQKCGQWAAHQATGGYVPESKVRELSPLGTRRTNTLMRLLVEVALTDAGAGLWSRVEWHGAPAVLFRDWDVWQETPEQVKARRDAWKTRQRESRNRRKSAQTSPKLERNSDESRPKLRQNSAETSHTQPTDQHDSENVTRDIGRDIGRESRHPYPYPLTHSGDSDVTKAALGDAPARNGSSELAGKIVAKYLGHEYASAVKTSMRLQASELLCAGHDPLDVEAAVELWTSRPGTSPKILPHLLSDVTRARNPSRLPAGFGTGTASAKAQGHMDAAENLIARRRAAENTTNPRELEA